jgi:hypothetical protein
MVNIIDSGTVATIEINKGDLPLDQIYTKEYFLLLDLEIIDNADADMITGGKSIIDTVIDKSESLVDYEVNSINKEAEVIVDNSESSLNKTLNNSNASNLEDEGIIKISINKAKSSVPINLRKYLEKYYENRRGITIFDSGLDYVELELIIRDVFIQLSYFDFLNISIDHIRMDEIYKINDRYVLIIEDGIHENQSGEQFAILNDFQKLIIELMGKEYQKGRSLELLENIRGTRVHKLINRMNDGVNNVW